MSRTHRSIPSAALCAVLTALLLAGCGKGTVIGSGPSPTSSPIVPNVDFEYPITTPASEPATITTGVNGYLYFTELATSKIGQLSTGGAVTELATKTAAAGPTSIIVGPDNNIWYTEANIHSIATFTSFLAASQTEYTIPWANSTPNFITRGAPFNSMYFTDTGANAIGEILATGTFAGPFAIPTAASSPQGIVTGPDNNEWFTEYATAKIGILNTTTNAITEIPVTAGSHPDIIAQGPDGALWFTENIAGAAKLGRMTTAHAYTEYALTGAHSAVGLAVDLAGDLVVTDPANNAIGVFKIGSQTYTEYPIGTAGSNPLWITLGPEGKMYFTEFSANKIGQFSYF